MNWRDTSELVFGYLLEGKISPTRVRPEMFHSPYDDGLDYLSQDKRNELALAIGFDALASAKYAAETISMDSGLDLVRLLEQAHANAVSSKALRKLAEQLERNSEVDWSRVNAIAYANALAQGETFTPLSEVNHEIPLWKKTGIAFFDHWNGGFPAIGVVNIAGRPKVGKTTLVMGIARSWVREHPTEQVAVFTLEMMASQFKARFIQLYPEITEEEMSRIQITDMPVNPHEAISLSAGVQNLGLVIMDFADLMVSGEIAEAQMSSLYRALAAGAKTLNTCICLISQLSGSYTGGVPRPFHVRYTRLAEALVVLNLMLYVPWNDYFELKDEEILPVMDGYGYVIRWFSRFENPQYAGLPLAIRVPFEGKRGWKLDAQGKDHDLRKFS